MHRKAWLFSLLLLVTASITKSQPYLGNIDYYSTANGLPNNSVISIYQDSKGFLWIGTNNGLCRYDGKEFKNYSLIDDKSRPWINSVTAITGDSGNNIWVSTIGGLIRRFNNDTRQWDKFIIDNDKDYATDIILNYRTLWFVTKQGKIGKILNDSVIVVKSLGNSYDSKIRRHSATELLVERHGIYKININTNEVKKIETIEQQKHLFVLDFIKTNGENIFYFLSKDKIISYTIKNARSTVINVKFNSVENRPGLTGNGNLLLTNHEQFMEITPEGEVLYRINLAEHSGTFKGITVNIAYKDNAGLYWIGTNSGLYKVDKNKTAFKNYTPTVLLNNIEYHYIRALYCNNNEVWIGTKEGKVGRMLYDTAQKTFTGKKWYPLIMPDKTIDDRYTVNALIKDDDGSIWAGGPEGIFRMKKNEHAFKKIIFKYIDTSIYLAGIWALNLDGSGRLLAGTHGSLYVVNLPDLSVRKCETADGKEVTFPVWNIYTSSKNEIWAGTGNGLYKAIYNPAKKTYCLHTVNARNTPSWQNVWNITEDKDNNLWFGSTETGIAKLDPEKNIFTAYDINNGLSTNVTSGIVADNYGNIWVSTIDGLSKLDTKTNRFINYKEEDGIISNDFNFKACIYTAWGEIFMGTKVGITCFNPKDVFPHLQINAPVEITAVKVKGIEITGNDSVIELTHNTNDISFRFALLDYLKKSTHTYKYRLTGYDTSWQNTSHENPTATYTNLPPGKYIFTVMASADGINWSEKTARLAITIKPALWQKPYFWVLIGLLLLSLVGYSIRTRVVFLIEREREKARVQKAMAELEMKALRAQMNPHFIFNSVGAIQHYIVKNNVAQANEYLSKFARLMRLYLESSRNNFILLSDEISLLHHYIILEKLRFEEKFDFIFSVSTEIPTSKLQIPSMLLQPFVENAINHGLVHADKKGLLEVKFYYNENNNILTCIIEDDGIGRQKAAQLKREKRAGHISMAGEIVEEKVKTLLEAEDVEISIDIIDKFDVNGGSGGTRVEVKIPCKYEATVNNESNIG